MPVQQLTLDKPYKNVDSASLVSHLEHLQDAYLDDLGSIVKRFGYKKAIDLGTNKPVPSLYWSGALNAYLAVSNGRVFILKKTGQTITATDLTGVTLGTGRATFAEAIYQSKTYVFIANGGRVVYTDGIEKTKSIPELSFPVTHIINFKGFLIVNKVGTNSFFYSNPLNPLSWSITDSYDAEASVDNIEGLTVLNERFYVWGKRSAEVWQSTGQAGDVFGRVPANYIHEGVLSPYTVSSLNNASLTFLDETRQVVSVSGNKRTVLSRAYAKDLQSLPTAQDSYSFNMKIDGKSFYVTTFKAANRTIVYDYDLDVWSDWGVWDDEQYTYNRFRANCYAYSPIWNTHLIGDVENGLIYELSPDVLDDDGTAIRGMFISGHINYGSDFERKRSKQVIARLKTGEGKYDRPNESPYMFVAKRDDNKSQFGGWKRIDLGNKNAPTTGRRTLYQRGGSYYSRQYKVILPDSTKVVLAGVWEDVRVG